MPRVALDTVRSGTPDGDVVRGALRAVATDPELRISLVGPDAVLAALLDEADTASAGQVDVVDAPGAVTADDDPVVAVRARRDASVRVAVDLLAEGDADVVLSAGPVPATVTAARFAVGRVRGLRHPALAVRAELPAGPLLVVDAGAAPDATAGGLVRFGELGAALARARGIAAPRVAALAPLGTSFRAVQELLTLFDMAGLESGEFVGALSAGEALDGHVDVLVTGGAAGRILTDTLRATTDAVDAHGVIVGTTGLVGALGAAGPDATAVAIRDLVRLVGQDLTGQGAAVSP